jgi:GAF domain-containing protein
MPDISKRLEKAEKLLQKGNSKDALEELLTAVKEDPRSDLARVKAADVAGALGRNADAARLYGEMFEQQVAAGDAGRAVLTFKKLAHFAAPHADQVLRYAGLLERTNKVEAAKTYQALVAQLIGLGDTKQALSAQRRLVALEPTPSTLVRQAELEAASRDSEAASNSFLAAAAQSKGDQAFDLQRRAYEHNKKNAAAALAYGHELLERSDFTNATKVMEAFAKQREFQPLYARALMEVGQLAAAEPHIWSVYEQDPAAVQQVTQLIGRYMDAGEDGAALTLSQRLEVRETQRKRRRDFILLIKDVVLRRQPRIEFLQYLSELLNSANREHDYCEVLGRLFDLHFAAGHFPKAADCLDRAGEVDPYDPGNQRRLQMLQGKVEAQRYATVAARFGKAAAEAAAPAPAQQQQQPPEPASEETPSNVLEDLMLQAEIFLQYGIKAKATERLQRINKLFPGEEQNNPTLRELYERAQFPVVPGAAPARPVAAGHAAAAAAKPAAAATPAASVDEVARLADVTRNMYRHSQVQGVLFAAAHDIGRLMQASRCVVALCSPGKPPSAFFEYCGAGIARSDVQPLVALIRDSTELVGAEPIAAVADASTSPVKKSAAALGVKSVAVARMSDRDEQVGVLIVGYAAQRAWTAAETSLLKTLADQAGIAANNVRLRKLVQSLAVREERSGLLKRSSYFDALMFEVTRSLQQHTPLTLALMRFGPDSLLRGMGEKQAEAAMQEVGQLIIAFTRQTDAAVRYDRTAIAVAFGDTNEQAAMLAIKKLRKAMSVARLGPQALQVACGIAEAVIRPNFDPADIVTELVNRADSALVSARAEGADATQSIKPPMEPAPEQAQATWL